MLWKRHQRRPSEATRAALVTAYAHLVPITVQRLTRAWGETPGALNMAEQEDYVSAGNIGLLRAVDQYDPSRGVKFETYAIALIRGQVRETLRERDWAPRSASDAIKALGQADLRLTQSLQRPPTDAELSAHLGESEETVRQWQRWANQRLCYSTDQPLVLNVPGGGDLFVIDILAGDGVQPDPEPLDAPLLRRERSEAIETALAALPERWACVLRRWADGATFREIAAGMGVSESRAYQLQQQALGRLRERGGLVDWDSRQ